jgi:prolyl 4-hydroxylase
LSRRGDYFGQEHWVMTRETHFIQMPSTMELSEITTQHNRILQESDRRLLQQYRDPTRKQMNITLTCLSVAPRVFEIDNFLSSIEIEHILSLASQLELSLSKTGDEDTDADDTESRTSYNTWISRETSPIIDAIYRRSADVLRIDESFFRQRTVDDSGSMDHAIPPNEKVSEDLQLVHYSPKQEYMAHHDFGTDDLDENKSYQSTRFATLLLYLNNVTKGGETSFPRWVNGETFRELKVKPNPGKAVLFYSQLPDGNLDDFSQHAGMPVHDGEKVRRICDANQIPNNRSSQ